MVFTLFLCSHAAMALSSKLPAPRTPASRICQAVYEAAACTSTLVSGRLALAARSLKVFTKSDATAVLVNGACSSKIVSASALFASADLVIGPGAGYTWKWIGGV